MLCQFILAESTKDDETGTLTERLGDRAFAKTLFVKVLTSYPGRCLAGSQWSIVSSELFTIDHSPITISQLHVSP